MNLYLNVADLALYFIFNLITYSDEHLLKPCFRHFKVNICKSVLS